MNENLSKMFIFAVGAAIGSVVTLVFAKKYYQRIADEEIDSMREYFQRHSSDQKESREDNAESENQDVDSGHVQYETVVSDLGYTAKKSSDYVNYATLAEPIRNFGTTSNRVTEEVDDVERPYVISPEEFGECDYNEISLTYYTDGVLTDEEDNPIEDVDDAVGLDFADHFGEYEDDSVFIRNDLRRVDFEILADLRKYSDVIKTNPYLLEDE